MLVLVTKSASEGALKAFDIFKESLSQGDKVFGLATGGTPEELYEMIRESDLDFSNAYSVNLDEYCGLEPNNPHSYHYYMQEKLFKVKPFKESFIPDGVIDEQVAIEAYESILKEYPVDLQLLGLGRNAHIGFNEPGTPFTQRTHKVALTHSTIESNQQYFKESFVPTHAISMGLQSIMDAKKIVLLAFGESKAEAVQLMIESEPSVDVPASILQLHNDVTIIVDEKAASLLTK